MDRRQDRPHSSEDVKRTSAASCLAVLALSAVSFLVPPAGAYAAVDSLRSVKPPKPRCLLHICVKGGDADGTIAIEGSRVSRGSGASGGRRTSASHLRPLPEYLVSRSCSGNGPDGSDDGCQQAEATCAVDEVRVWGWVRYLDPKTRKPLSDWRQLPGSRCHALADAPPATTALGPLVESEFRRLALPGSRVQVQPTDGSVVNIPTIAYTDSSAITRSVSILGQQVTITAEPRTWSWHWGDGTTTTTRSPGHRYPNHDVSHAYRRTGRYAVRVTVRYTGSYTVGGSESRPIAGTVSVTGSSRYVTVREARPHLFGGTR